VSSSGYSKEGMSATEAVQQCGAQVSTIPISEAVAAEMARLTDARLTDALAELEGWRATSAQLRDLLRRVLAVEVWHGETEAEGIVRDELPKPLAAECASALDGTAPKGGDRG
jgi:DNA-binding MurR/RpiR family transcriptional regulator